MLKFSLYLILIIFSLLLREFLTPLSLILLVLSSYRLISQRRLNQWGINALCLLIFCYYLITFGKFITPEIGINFLFNVILLKFMESKKFRDDVMCIFGTILLISSGSLFDKTLIYFAFFTLSFFLLLHQFSKLNKVELFTLKNISSYLKLLLLVVALFFIFPRIPNPIPFSLNAGSTGEIGYSPEVNISSVERLEENDTKVFWAQLTSQKGQDELYWRGNVVSVTDGWNWGPGTRDQGLLKTSQLELTEMEEYRLFIKTPYLFVFDHSPSFIKVQNKVYASDDTNSFNASYIRNSNRYFAQVLQDKSQSQDHIPAKEFLTHQLSEKTLLWIHETFPDQELEDIIKSYRQFITREKFRYSWSPGKIKSIEEFFEKKIGFCTHYASSLALILRSKNFPARLISGFQGGRFNPYGGFYEVSQNDAHAWVEVFNGQQWLRVDPTSFVAPERIIMDYQEVVSNNFSIPTRGSESQRGLFTEVKFIISQWDFVFYQLMDQWDAIEQLSFFSRFQITRKMLFFISLFLLTGCVLLLLRGRERKSKREKLWESYLAILEQNKIYYRGNFSLLKSELKQVDGEARDILGELLEEFIRLFYAQEDREEIIEALLKKLNQ